MRSVVLLIGVAIVSFLFFVVPGFYIVSTGNVGVEETWGEVDLKEKSPGPNWVFWIVSDAWEYSTKTITVDLNDMQPKAADNLSLRDLDVSIFYRVAPSMPADLYTKFASEAVKGDEGWYSGYNLILREGRSAVYEAVAEIDSLKLHRNREVLSADIRRRLQNQMSKKMKDKGLDENAFYIERVAIRQLRTDSSIEDEIQAQVKAQKKLERKQVEVEIAKKDAEVEIERARGIAESNKIINNSLTAAYLQHEINKALQSFADNGNSTVVIPANMEGFEMILDGKNLGSK